MYANPSRNEYDALVKRVRDWAGPGVQIGSFNGTDIEALRKLDEKRIAAEAKAKEDRPINEAAARLAATLQRSMKAWVTINEKREALSKNRRLHDLNGSAPEWFDPVEIPQQMRSYPTVDEYDAANAQASIVATALETRAQKMTGYLGEWERSGPDQRCLSIILKLAARIEQLEENRQLTG